MTSTEFSTPLEGGVGGGGPRGVPGVLGGGPKGVDGPQNPQTLAPKSGAKTAFELQQRLVSMHQKLIYDPRSQDPILPQEWVTWVKPHKSITFLKSFIYYSTKKKLLLAEPNIRFGKIVFWLLLQSQNSGEKIEKLKR